MENRVCEFLRRWMRRLSILLSLFVVFIQAGQVDHWETVVYAGDTWKYFRGMSEPDVNWRILEYDDSDWLQGPGGIGYADGDDRTVIGSCISLYLRMPFTIVDISKIESAIFHIDYDDGFIAYINDIEIGRSNVSGEHPFFDTFANSNHEADGSVPESFPIDSAVLASCLVQGENLLAIQVHNVSQNSSDMSSTSYLSLGINDPSTFYRPMPGWYQEPFEFESSNLPIVVITTENGATIPDEPKIKAHMGIIYNGPGVRNHMSDPFNHYDGNIGIERRGNKTAGYPKKPYVFETRQANDTNLNVPLLGMPQENDWILRAAYADKTFLRDALAYHMSRGMGKWAPRTVHCEVVLNGQYQGVYVLVEKIKPDKNRLNIVRMDSLDIYGDDVTGGYIYEVGQDGDFGDRRGLKYPKQGDVRPEQLAYIRSYDDDFRALMERDNYNDPDSGYTAWIDVDYFIDEILLQEACKNSDAYGWSSYFHKNRLGKLHAGPAWDFDQALSNSTFNDGPNYSEWIIIKSEVDQHLRNNHPAFWRKLFHDPVFRQQLNDRWFDLRNSVWSTDSLFHFIDTNAVNLNEAQQRNFNQWPILGVEIWRSTPGATQRDTYQKEIDYMKTFLKNRLEWMDAELAKPVSVEEQTQTTIQSFTLSQNYPNPFNPSTVISYDLPVPEWITLKIYNTRGEEIRTLVHENQAQGRHVVHFHADDLASGVYFYQLQVGRRFLKTKKMLLMR